MQNTLLTTITTKKCLILIIYTKRNNWHAINNTLQKLHTNPPIQTGYKQKHICHSSKTIAILFHYSSNDRTRLDKHFLQRTSKTDKYWLQTSGLKNDWWKFYASTLKSIFEAFPVIFGRFLTSHKSLDLSQRLLTLEIPPRFYWQKKLQKNVEYCVR